MEPQPDADLAVRHAAPLESTGPQDAYRVRFRTTLVSAVRVASAPGLAGPAHRIADPLAVGERQHVRVPGAQLDAHMGMPDPGALDTASRVVPTMVCSSHELGICRVPACTMALGAF